MARNIFQIAGLALILFGLVFTITIPASLSGVVSAEKMLEVSGTQILNSGSPSTTISFTVRNIKDVNINVNYYAFVEESIGTLSGSVVSLPQSVSNSINAGESKSMSIILPCNKGGTVAGVLLCNSDKSYRDGKYRVIVAFWKATDQTANICSVDPHAFDCNYVEIHPIISNEFSVVAPSQAEVSILACSTIDWSFVVIGGGCIPLGRTDPAVGKRTYTSGEQVTFTAIEEEGKTQFKYWLFGFTCTSCPPATKVETKSVTRAVENNEVYVAIFENIEKPKLKLTILVPNGDWGKTVPAPGVYEYDAGSKVSITMTPNANITQDKSVTVHTLIGYTIQKSNSPIPDSKYYPKDNEFLTGTKSALTVEVVVDADTTIIVSFGQVSVLKNPNGDVLPPTPPTIGGFKFNPLGFLVSGAGVALYLFGRRKGA